MFFLCLLMRGSPMDMPIENLVLAVLERHAPTPRFWSNSMSHRQGVYASAPTHSCRDGATEVSYTLRRGRVRGAPEHQKE